MNKGLVVKMGAIGGLGGAIVGNYVAGTKNPRRSTVIGALLGIALGAGLTIGLYYLKPNKIDPSTTKDTTKDTTKETE